MKGDPQSPRIDPTDVVDVHVLASLASFPMGGHFGGLGGVEGA